MDNNRDGFYCSQPAPKSARMTEPDWRRGRRLLAGDQAGSSSNTPQEGAEQAPENPPKRKTFAVPVEESKYWSKDVVEFYTNGDSPFCYTRFSNKKLDRNFWGALLGCQADRSLSPIHVEAWTCKIMRMRQALLLKNPRESLRWTVLPPCFYDDMKDQQSTAAIDMAGRKDPYPPFWEVDHVYLPINVSPGDWLLIRIDMRNMEITQYWTDKRWRNEKRFDAGHYVEMVRLFFGWFLERIHYWANSEHDTKYELFEGLAEVDVPQDNGNVPNSGVLVCMMMDKLVRNQSLILEEDVEEACVNYRRQMANVLYYWRRT